MANKPWWILPGGIVLFVLGAAFMLAFIKDNSSLASSGAFIGLIGAGLIWYSQER